MAQWQRAESLERAGHPADGRRSDRRRRRDVGRVFAAPARGADVFADAASPRDAGRALVGPVLYTVDATDLEQWRYFSFHVGSVIENPSARDWDLAFRRYQIIANGGREFVAGGDR